MAAALHAVGLDGFSTRPLDTLSGGQMQRALFARVILQDAPVVLLDEPFAAIDDRTVGDLMHLVDHWHREGRTVVAVLHDIELVRRHFPQTLLLAREPIAWGATAVALRPENLQRARAMPEAWDERAPWHDHDHEEHVH
jgi:zinc/manganese transport system ATP-binding protein